MASRPGPSNLIAIFALVSACFLLYFVGIGTYPAIDPAEAYYVEAAREMVEIGNYVTPHLNYQIYFSKPIMTFWLIAGSYNIFGVSEWASRIPFASLCTIYVLSAFVLAKHLINNRAGIISGLCLACSPLLLLVARESPIDIAFSTFLGIAVMATAMTLSGKSKYSWTFIYIGLGLSMLSKGPAGILLYCISAIFFLLLARPKLEQLKSWLADLKILPGLLLFALVVLPWHLWVWRETDGLFLKVFFLYENIARYAGHTNMGRMSVWFFVPVLFVGFLPFVSVLIPAMTSVWKAREATNLAERSGLFKSFLGIFSNLKTNLCSYDSGVNRALGFLVVFSAVTFSFFSFSGTKLITYILPIMGPLAVITALYLERALASKIEAQKQGTKPSFGNLALFSVSFKMFGGLISAAAIASVVFVFSDLAISYKLIAIAGAIVCIAGVIRHHILYKKGQVEKSVYATLATLVLSWGILGTLGFHLFYNHQQSDLMKVSTRAGEISTKVNMFGVFNPSSMFYAKQPVNTFFLAKQFIPLSKNEAKTNEIQAVIVRDRDLDRMKSTANKDLKLKKKAQYGEWGLYTFPGFKVEKVMILEDVFKVEGVFDRLMAGDTSMGPLTVPYAAGRAYKVKSEGRLD